jgi:NAD(P)H-binding
MIVITTPTGQIGRQVIDRLLGTGEMIRVIARDPSRLSPQVRDRVSVVPGSHGESDVVTKAFTGADCVFWLVPPNARADSPERYYPDFTRPACEAIKNQGVRRVVGVSTLGHGYHGKAGVLSAALAYYTSTAQQVFMRVPVDPATLDPAGHPEFVAAIDSTDDFCLDEDAGFAYVTRHRGNTIDRVPLEPRHGSEVRPIAGDPFDPVLAGRRPAAGRTWSSCPPTAATAAGRPSAGVLRARPRPVGLAGRLVPADAGNAARQRHHRGPGRETLLGGRHRARLGDHRRTRPLPPAQRMARPAHRARIPGHHDRHRGRQPRPVPGAARRRRATRRGGGQHPRAEGIRGSHQPRRVLPRQA